jgi:hypothetical protein
VREPSFAIVSGHSLSCQAPPLRSPPVAQRVASLPWPSDRHALAWRRSAGRHRAGLEPGPPRLPSRRTVGRFPARWRGPGRLAPPAGGGHRCHLGGLRPGRSADRAAGRRADDRRRAGDRAGRARSPTLQHGLQRGVQRHAVVLPPPPLRCSPSATSRRRWMEAWDAYREFNKLFAHTVAKVAPEGGRVLVQDYHLALMGTELARLRPDLHSVHFTHTPFADPSVLRMLPTAVGTELLSACPTSPPAGSTPSGGPPPTGQSLALPGPSATAGRTSPTFVSPLSTDEASDCGRQRPIRLWPGRRPALEEKIGGSRPPGHRAGGQDGAIEESAPRLLGLRGTAGERTAPARTGGVGGPGLSHPPRATRLSGLPERGGVDGGPASTSAGPHRGGLRSSSKSRTTTRDRSPPCPATTFCWSTRSGTA